MKQSIELTKEQFEALLKSAYIGNWMINAHRITPIKKYEDILFHIFSYASKFGLDHFVDSENSTIYPSGTFEEDPEILEFIDDYDNNTLWDELCERLALRDALKMHGEEKLKNMEGFDRLKLLCDLEDNYHQHFHEHHLDLVNLHIMR